LESREKIVSAAVEVFAEKGRYGARMEEIAAKAGVNKAMLYYYYTSKENLYREVLRSIISKNFNQIFTGLKSTSAESGDFTKRVRAISRLYFKVFSSNQSHTKILFEALAIAPTEVQQIVRAIKAQSELVFPEKLLEIFEEGIYHRSCRDIDPRQIVISLIGMNLIYFLTSPIAEVLLDLDVKDQPVFLREREESVIDLLLHGLVREEV
jgi:TetR/AcrR family transcriptional regulator